MPAVAGRRAAQLAAVIAVVIAVALLVSGCGGGPATAEPPAAAPSATGFVIASTSIVPGEIIPARFTCDGDDASPEISWSGAPEGTGALVLVVDDPDAGGFVHWIVLDLAGSAEGSLPEGISGTPGAPREGTNDFGDVGWSGPCPPSGEHHYRFMLRTLAAPLSLPGAPGGRDVRDALDRSTILGTAMLEATYSRP